MTKQKRRFYWDSFAFLSVFNKEPGHEKYREVIRLAERGEALIITSAIALVEVVKIKGKAAMGPKDEQAIRDFFEHSYIQVIGVTRNLAEEARKLVWEKNLDPKDAVHIATAIFAQVQEIHTTDHKMTRLSGFAEMTIGEPKNIQTEMELPKGNGE
jgi:predicted nucleic acid-binding protein